jgi:hypothetical protein
MWQNMNSGSADQKLCVVASTVEEGINTVQNPSSENNVQRESAHNREHRNDNFLQTPQRFSITILHTFT